MTNYLIIVNAIEFLLMGFDKHQAIKHKYRIPEITLIFINLIGGSIGGITGMYFFHHKTNKLKFRILYPLILIIHIIIYINKKALI